MKSEWTKRHLGFARAASAALIFLSVGPLPAAPLTLSNAPLFLTTSSKANVLVLYGNSNSMDSDATGRAVGSDNPASKSEVARNAIKSIITNYSGRISMGLIAYQQDAHQLFALHDSQYDVSYSPADYNPAFALTPANRAAATKKYRISSPVLGTDIYYNVNLPFYAASSQGNAFCSTTTACTDPTHNFAGTAGSACTMPEHPTAGPWDTYDCYFAKSGPSNGLAPGNGYNFYFGSFGLLPTDSDIAQGITDFGSRLAWQYVGPTWFSNTSPGRGYVHTAIAPLDATQGAKLNVKLGTSQFATNAPTNPNFPLQNAGLTPLEGSVLTANNYFNGTLASPAQGGPLTAPPNSCGKNFLVMLTDGLPSVTMAGVASANPALNLSNLATQVTALKGSPATVTSYVVGYAIPPSVNPAQLDTIASAGGTSKGYYATDTATLNSAFAAIFADILARTAAASSVALNSQSLNSGSRVYQAKFSSTDWSGQLLSRAINADGSLSAPIWDAGQVINGQGQNTRSIVTYKPSTKKGIPFRWPNNPSVPSSSELDTNQSTALNTNISSIDDGQGNARLRYIRGEAVNEAPSGLGFRARPTSKLADIVDSAPRFVGAPQFNYNETSYIAFRTAQLNRTPMLYVGANDGMLHGFDAATGTERLAYVPSALYRSLSHLTSPGYVHKFFVDGTPNSADVFYSGSWHTALVSGMGSGARGIFSLDITDPSTFSEANAATQVNFEFTDLDDADVGFISGQVPIVKLNNGAWAAVFGNGYNGTGTGTATLFLVNIKTGALIKKISTGVGSVGTPNALANPIAIDVDGNQTADIVYAGDLQGNVWKFDINAPAASSWVVAYGGLPLFTAPQPITTTPDIGRNPKGGLMVLFGTGKYVENSDLTTTAANAFYGIWDNGSPVSAATLVAQTVTGTPTIGAQTFRTVSQNSIDWAANKGWRLTLPTSGERLVTDSVLHNGRIIFTTTIPDPAPCSFGGSSWLMELDYLSGAQLVQPPIDTNGDGLVNSSDTPVAGVAIVSIGSAPAIQRGFGTATRPTEMKYINESSGAVTGLRESGDPTASGRNAWRQIR